MSAHRLKKVLAAGILPYLLSVVTPVMGENLEEIVVTATKRAENIQDVSVSITAFTSEDLHGTGTNFVHDLGKHTPGLLIQRSFGVEPNVATRGVGSQDFEEVNARPTTMYSDEVPLLSTFMATSQMFDVERVEVLKGPQGTLYGRNSTGGAINIISNKPTKETEGMLRVGYDNYDTWSGEAVLSGSLTESVQGRVAVSFRNQGEGYFDVVGTPATLVNQSNGELNGEAGKDDIQAYRALVNWDVSDDLSVLFNVHGSRNNSSPAGGVMQGQLGPGCDGIEDFTNCTTLAFFGPNVGTSYQNPVPGDPYVVRYSEQQDLDYTHIGGTLTLDWSLANDINVKYIGAWDQSNRIDIRDDDATPFRLVDIYYDNDFHQLTQELRVSRTSGELFWVVGFFYSDDTFDYDKRINLFDAFGIRTVTRFKQQTESYAVFGQAEWRVTDEWELIGGIRYTNEDRICRPCVTDLYGDGAAFGLPSDPFFGRIGPNPVDELKTDNVSFRAGVEYHFQDSSMAYVTYSTGFKSGGFDATAALDIRTLAPFEEESLSSIEAGLKLDLLDGALRLNAAGFYYDYEDMQAAVGITDPLTNNFIQTHPGLNVDVYGAELEAFWRPVQSLSISTGVAWLDTNIDNAGIFDDFGNLAVGEELADAPEWSFNAVVAYSHPLRGGFRLDLQGDFVWVDNRILLVSSRLGESDNSWEEFGARLTLVNESKDWEVSLWGRNLTDNLHFVYGLSHTLVGITGTIKHPNTPRTYGLEFTKRF